MLGKIVRLLLTLTAVAPALITLAFVYVSQDRYVEAAIATLLCLSLASFATLILRLAHQRLEKLPISIKKVKSADKEVLGSVVTYALPLLLKKDQSLIDPAMLAAAGVMLVFVFLVTHSFQVNPLLAALGYHFYDVETDDGVTYLLITRRRINNTISIRMVVQLSEYGILEVN